MLRRASLYRLGATGTQRQHAREEPYSWQAKHRAVQMCTSMAETRQTRRPQPGTSVVP